MEIMTKRIEYLDALRGFVMLLVVLGHVPMYCYHQVGDISFSLIFTTFHIPLFFFISGWFYKIDSGGGSMYCRQEIHAVDSTNCSVLSVVLLVE